jgi:transposase InsO family protein
MRSNETWATDFVHDQVDQESEFMSRDLDLWAYHRGVTLDFSRPGNALIEAFQRPLLGRNGPTPRGNR